tara:strand:- start:9769 stop:11139 length:1371 start_codon:yes stop_codon:yes gene_type:complete
MFKKMGIKTIILAAGQGTRMKSNTAKVLHKIAGKPMLQWVVDTANQLDSQTIVVYGHDAEQVIKKTIGHNIRWVEQKQQLGTGHAVQQAIAELADDDLVLILYGDVPLIKKATLANMLAVVDNKTMSLLTVKLNDATGYGRIVRDNGRVVKIVEQKDATQAQRQISEVNTGIMAIKGDQLRSCLSKLKNNNAQNEYYLTDIIEMLVESGVSINTTHPDNEREVQGVNSKLQLNQLERYQQRLIAEDLMEQGVTLTDAKRLDVRGELIINGQDIFIDCNVIFEGKVTLGSNVSIGANCVIKNAQIDDDAQIYAHSVLEDCCVGKATKVGPFARIRPGTVLGDNSQVGNFVEVKKTNLGKGSKINHLSYIGDAEVGQRVNIGAGTITCNYDGVNKSKTTIEDGAFIGSDTQLVAPVTVGKNATIAAGTTLTKNAAANTLSLSRTKQTTLKGWKRPTKD